MGNIWLFNVQLYIENKLCVKCEGHIKRWHIKPLQELTLVAAGFAKYYYDNDSVSIPGDNLLLVAQGGLVFGEGAHFFWYDHQNGIQDL